MLMSSLHVVHMRMTIALTKHLHCYHLTCALLCSVRFLLEL